MKTLTLNSTKISAKTIKTLEHSAQVKALIFKTNTIVVILK